MEQPVNRPHRNGLILLVIIAIFTLPVIFAWFFYKHADEIPTGTTNHGYLINPPFQLGQLHVVVIKAPRTNPLKVEHPIKQTEELVSGKWLIFTLNPKRCEKACQRGLYNIRQIRLATNADQNRVVTAVLSFNKPANNDPLNQLLQTDYAGTYSLRTNEETFKRLAARYIKHNYALLEGAIYIADPLRNVILVYAPNTDPELIYKDLHHLLQVSQIG
ncbi:MAG TPA: hypothetical protein VD770_03640 [Coxiellaceae bacterium]|nr:hypothetical protein [Coxiellaceae bacterium]